MHSILGCSGHWIGLLLEVSGSSPILLTLNASPESGSAFYGVMSSLAKALIGFRHPSCAMQDIEAFPHTVVLGDELSL
jgi:hypothetical protein